MAFEQDAEGSLWFCQPKGNKDSEMESKQCNPPIMKPEQSDANRQVGQDWREPFHSTCVMMVFFAPASFKADAIVSAVSGSTRAIMLPPRPPPLNLAPSAPAFRAASTSWSKPGEETVSFCNRV